MNPAHTPLAARLAKALEPLRQVELAYLFGSHLSGRERLESDIDVGVLVGRDAADDPFAALNIFFDRLGRVVPSQKLDIVLLNNAPGLLRHRILSSGLVLLERTPETRVRFAIETIRDYQDMQIRREFFYRNRLKRLKEEQTDGGSRDLLAQARHAARILGETPRLPADQ